MLWTAARRLLALDLLAAACVAIPFVANGRMGRLPAVSGVVALALLVCALFGAALALMRRT